MQLVARKAPFSPGKKSSKSSKSAQGEVIPSKTDRSHLKATLETALTPWSPFTSAVDCRGNKQKIQASSGPIKPPSHAQRKLAETQLKTTLENLLEPKVRLNIAGKEIHSTLKEHDDYERKIVSLSRDYLTVIIRRINIRIDRFLRAHHFRSWLSRLVGKSRQAGAAAQSLPFAVNELAIVRSDGLLIAHVSGNPDATKLPAFLKQESRRTSHDAIGKSNSKQSAFFSRLTAFANTNTSPTDHFSLQTGHRAALVAAIQGIPPKKFRRHLAQTHRAIEDELATEPWLPNVPERIEKIHLRHLHLLNDFAREHRTAPFPWLQVIFFALAALPLLAGMIAFAHYQHWSRVDRTLAKAPGFEIIHSSPWSRPLVIAGLRDPLAPQPQTILKRAGIDPSNIHLRFTSAPSNHPDFILTRATHALQPPEGLTLTLDGSTLRASGSAPRSWIAAARANTPLLFPGLVYDDSKVLDSTFNTPTLPANLAEQLVHQRVFFEEGKTNQPILTAGHMTEVSEIIFQLQEEAQNHNLPVEIKIVGRYSIPNKPFDIAQLNQARDRASHIRNLLLALRPGIDPIHLHAIAEHPFAEENNDLSRLNRAIEFQVTLDGQDISPPPPITDEATPPWPQ
ncbi:MAG: hypothetical protein AAGD22_09820 [Verrucomicrobiota bacterium]